MDEHSRLIFLTRHYSDLKGLALAPLWCIGIFLTLIWQPHGPIEGLATLFGIIVGSMAWLILASQYYRTHFGWLKPDPLCLGIKKTRSGARNFLYWLMSVAIGSEFIYCIRTRSLNDFPSWIFAIVVIGLADLMVQKTLDRENPPARRLGYGIGAALIVVIELLNLFAKCDIKTVLAVMSVTMLTLNIADHLLLLRLLTPPDREIDA